MKTINITPTWAGCLPILIEATRNGTAEGQRMAREEFERMARMLDELNSRDRVTSDKPKRLVLGFEGGGLEGVYTDHPDLIGLDYTTIDLDVEGIEASRCVLVDGREAFARDHKVQQAKFPVRAAGDYPPSGDDETETELLRDDPANGEPWASLARAAGYEIDADSSGEKQWMLGPYDPEASSPLYWTAKEVCEAEGLKPPETNTADIGLFIRDMIEDREFKRFKLDGDTVEEVGGDEVTMVDVSDAHNPRIYTASGTIFVVRIFREG